jgi:hypothetical protein
VAAASTTCDSFAPGNSNSECQLTLYAQVFAGTTTLLTATQECDCSGQQKWYNQKYAITSNTNRAPGKSWWFGSTTHTYYWNAVTMSQWCTNSPLQPDITLFPDAVTIEYQHPGTPPTKMPGAYINGDVRAWQDVFQSFFAFMAYALTGDVKIYNTSSGEGMTGYTTNGGIYIWDGTTTAKRGPGGSPITPCQGVAL